MKIRPKTFECVMDLINRGYVLYVNGKPCKILRDYNNEVLLESGYTWRHGNNHIWQRFYGWYFEEPKK